LGFIKANAIRFTRPSRFKGVTLGGSNRLPVSWINGAGARTTITPGAKGRSGRLRPYARVTVLATRSVGRRRYTQTGPKQWVKSDRVRTARLRKIPPGLKPGQKWIHVSLAEWTLTAYVGAKPVFATVVSPGNNTPRGRYRITRKLATATLGWKTKNGVYEVEGVPWVMYFKPHFAFHAAYWHDLFGFVESHGCINLSPADARRLFEWATPSLPAGWYTIRATPRDPGTVVIIE
jgi:lipoprotein-anchoring transpeptidase ErfK/SrfK